MSGTWVSVRKIPVVRTLTKIAQGLRVGLAIQHDGELEIANLAR